MTLREQLTKIKDRVPTNCAASIVYSIPCSCGKVYIGETCRRLKQRLEEHRNACMKGDEKASAIAEHAWKDHCPIVWSEAKILDR